MPQQKNVQGTVNAQKSLSATLAGSSYNRLHKLPSWLWLTIGESDYQVEKRRRILQTDQNHKGKRGKTACAVLGSAKNLGEEERAVEVSGSCHKLGA